MPDRPDLRLDNIVRILTSFQDKFAGYEKALVHVDFLESIVGNENPAVKEAIAVIRKEFDEYKTAAFEIGLVSQKVQDLSIVVYAASQVGLATAVVDPDTGLHILDTKAYVSLTGYTSDELEYVPWEKIFMIEESRPISRKSKFNFSEMSIITKDGTVIPVEAGVGTGKYAGRDALVVYLKDISERKKLEKEKESLRRRLEAQKNLKGMINAVMSTVQGIAHDLSNKATILQNIEHIWPGKKGELYRETAGAAKYIADVVSNLQNFASGRITEEFSYANAKELALEVIPLFQRRCDEAGVRLEYCLSDDCKIFVQRTGFKRALDNLLENAFEAIGAVQKKKVEEWDGRKEVCLSVARDQSDVLVSVRDTGVGLEVDYIPKLFKSIFSTKDKGKPSGYGLGNVFSFVVHNKGDVFPESEGLGKGSTFYMRFPYVEKPTSQQQPL
ncbi:MAG: HAMP domain-containing sensor histidine kinase [Candidatus Woesearchaeota archaeon]|nr:HAMP domain-containing sensor histidine kinase [Candidatus Woesearchaeota archaeon]